jgi:limonene-1,2-epoxide hydrolase
MGDWETAAPAYRYGWEAAGWSRYAGRPWREVALDLERGWHDYQRSLGRRVLTEWEGFKKAVEEGYTAAAAEVKAAPAAAPVDPERLVRDFLEAYNSKGKASLDTIMASLAPDAEVSFTPLAGLVRGERNLRAAFTGLFADEAGTQIVLGDISGGPDRLVAEWTERGRNYRTAEDVLRKVAGIFEVADGKIVALRMYPVRLR